MVPRENPREEKEGGEEGANPDAFEGWRKAGRGRGKDSRRVMSLFRVGFSMRPGSELLD